MATVTGLTAASSLMPFVVASGSETRPSTPGRVLWIGGTTKPSNMTDGDLWFKESAAAASAPQFVTTSLNTITQSVAFTQALVLNGTTPMTFNLTAGSLPSGMTLNASTGVITGTPSASGSYSFTVQATNAVGSASQAYSGTVSATAVAPTVTTTTLSSMVQGTAFAQTLSATGTSPITWSISGGVLPSGLNLNSSTGAITGTPTGTGAYSFTVQASNAAGAATKSFTGTIGSTGTAPDITTTTLNALQAGVAFTQTLSRTGSTPMTWGVSAGSIPAGLAVNSSTGVLAGTPTTAGAYSFTVQATNSFGSDVQAYTGTIAAASTAGNYSIFGATTTDITSYTDGDSGAWTSHQYYQWSGAAALPAGTKIVGARVYIPSGSSHIGQPWEAALFVNTSGGLIIANGTFDHTQYDSNGSKKSGSALVAGWNELLFTLEYDVPSSAGSWFIGTRINNGVRYLFNTTLTTNAIREPGNKNFFLAENDGRSWYNSTKTQAKWYGLDTLVKIPG